MTQLLRIQDLSVAYQRGQPVLTDINLTLHSGQFTGIVGPSGSGKTTLLKVLTGVLAPPRRGRQDLWQGTVERRRSLRVSYVPQLETINWDFPVTVFECVLMGRPQHGARLRASKVERADVMAALDRLGIGHLAGRHIRELSGGQQQRMFLARALTRQPDLLLLDEPTSGVDITTRHAMLHLLGDLNEAGLAIVLTTHDLNGMAAHLPNLVCMNRRIIAEGRPAEVLRAGVLEATFGAGLDVLTHLGMPVVVDAGSAAVDRGAGQLGGPRRPSRSGSPIAAQAVSAATDG